MFIKQLLIFICLISCANTSLCITTNTEIITLNDEQFYLEDKSRSITITTILNSERNLEFKKVAEFTPGYSSSRFSGKFSVANTSSNYQELVLMLTNSSCNHIEFYKVQNKQILDSTILGVDFPFSSRQSYNNNYIFKFNLASKDSCEIYWMIQNKAGSLNSDYLLMPFDKFQELDTKRDTVLSIFNGIQICLTLFALILFGLFRKRVYLFYGLYVGCIFLALFSNAGYAHQFLWSNSPFFAHISRILWIILSIIFSISFAINLLEIKFSEHKKLLLLFRSFQLFFVLWIMSMLLNIAENYAPILLKVNYLIILISNIALIITAIKTIPQNKQVSYFYLCSFLPIILVILLGILFHHNITPTHPDFVSFVNSNYFHLTMVAVTIEAILMMISISIKFRNAEKQKVWLTAKLDNLERQIQNQDSKSSPDQAKISEARDDELVLKTVHSNLLDLMNNDKIYLDETITLPKLANMLETTPHLLSKSINTIEKMHFFDFINLYRVATAKTLLKQPDKQNLTIEGIAFEVGFNNKTSFNKAFKKFTNSTPSQYKKM